MWSFRRGDIALMDLTAFGQFDYFITSPLRVAGAAVRAGARVPLSAAAGSLRAGLTVAPTFMPAGRPSRSFAMPCNWPAAPARRLTIGPREDRSQWSTSSKRSQPPDGVLGPFVSEFPGPSGRFRRFIPFARRTRTSQRASYFLRMVARCRRSQGLATLWPCWPVSDRPRGMSPFRN